MAQMSKYKAIQPEMDACQWFKNGDHPNDNSGHDDKEGAVVRRFRHPNVCGDALCSHCDRPAAMRGILEKIEPYSGHIPWHDLGTLIPSALSSTAGADLLAELARLREALTPSGSTKAAYIAEFSFSVSDGVDEDGNETSRRVIVPWDTVKEIMAAIRKRASGEKE